ncbi:hypothetical protein ANO11243_092290 [Dothideomycetidae sp. 11243]|nr:hypothetical protein ANO11243_092290 [fungal sp. No.11243]
MTKSTQQTAVIIGAGPFISRSLSLYLASQNYAIGLISRTKSSLDKLASEIASKHPDSKVFVHAADVGDSQPLTSALDALKAQLGGSVTVLVYNAARVGPSALLSLSPSELETDLRTSAIGTLVAGQWFSHNADAASKPLLLITGGVLDREPNADYASLSAAKAASQCVGRMFAQTLPEKHGIRVGMPLIVEPIIPAEGGGYVTKSDPDVIVEKIFRPFFEARERDLKEWTVERLF